MSFAYEDEAFERVKHMVVTGFDDWHGLFVDGELVDEGHQVTIHEIVLASRGQAFTLEEWSEPRGMDTYLAMHGRFGHTQLADVRNELEKYT